MTRWFDREPSLEGYSPLGLCLIFGLLCFNFLNFTLVLKTFLQIIGFPTTSCGLKISARLEYPTKIKWVMEIPSGLKSLIAGACINSQSSNSLSTSFKWVTFLKCTFATKNGIWIIYLLRLCSKKYDQYKYSLHRLETKNILVTNLGSRKGVPSKPKSFRYECSSSRNKKPLPSKNIWPLW